MARTIERQFDALPEATRGADLVVGGGVQIAGRSVAEQHGIPYRYLIYCPALLPSADYPPVTLPVTRLPRWLTRSAWLLSTKGMGALVRRPLNRRRRAMGLAPVKDAYRHLMTERPLVAAEPALAPVPPDCPYDATAVGCLHVATPEPLPQKLEAFLSSGPPPVFFGFGSMTDPDAEETTGLLLEAIERLGCRAVIQAGWADLGTGPLPEPVFRAGPCSHAALFPRCAALVHHGGAGTTTAAARAGVPQVVVAHVADQFYWGRRVQELGLGPPPLRRSKLDVGALTEVLSATLSNDLVAERARDMGDRLRSRHPLDDDPVRFLRDPF
jgi:UDP:flavonoid glycosyltransferase YjiC (YdhE family)